MSNGQFLDWAFQYRGIQFELLSLLSIAKLCIIHIILSKYCREDGTVDLKTRLIVILLLLEFAKDVSEHGYLSQM